MQAQGVLQEARSITQRWVFRVPAAGKDSRIFLKHSAVRICAPLRKSWLELGWHVMVWPTSVGLQMYSIFEP